MHINPTHASDDSEYEYVCDRIHAHKSVHADFPETTISPTLSSSSSSMDQRNNGKAIASHVNKSQINVQQRRTLPQKPIITITKIRNSRTQHAVHRPHVTRHQRILRALEILHRVVVTVLAVPVN